MTKRTLKQSFNTIFHSDNAFEDFCKLDLDKEIETFTASGKTIYKTSAKLKKYLQFIDRVILRHLAREIDVVHSFTKNKSTLTAVKAHSGNSHFFLTDIKNFYPNVKSEDVRRILNRDKSRTPVSDLECYIDKLVDLLTTTYLEKSSDSICLEQRSFGYIKSDLYGFIGKDRYIITEDKMLEGFLKYLIKTYNIDPFFEYEIIPVGGESQITAIAKKNDSHKIFGEPNHLIAVVDKDIERTIRKKWKSESKLYFSPVKDIELHIWKNKDKLLPDIKLKEFKHAKKEKDTAKTYCNKVVNSGQKIQNDLYSYIVADFQKETEGLIQALKQHLCLNNM